MWNFNFLKMWEIEIFFLIEEPSKIFVYFLYNLHPLFHMKVSKISFSNSWLFPHADDPFLQETPSELAERRSDVGVGEHVELHPPVMGASVVVYHVVKMLADMEGLGHALCRWLYVVVGYGGVRRRVSIPQRLLMSHQYSSLWKHTNQIFFSLCIHFLSPS